MCQACDIRDVTAAPSPRVRAGRFLAGLSPYTKLAVMGAGLLLNLGAGSAAVSAVLGVSVLALVVSAGLKPATLLRRLLVPWYMAAVAVATQVFLAGNTVLIQVGPFTAYREGLASGTLLGSRIFAGTAVILAFTLLTSVTDLMALASRLRLSPVMIEIASLTFRYLFLLADEAQRIREAQVARLGHSSWSRSIRSYGILIGMLMARSYDKAEGVYQAMTSRGYRGQVPSAACTTPRGGDLVAGTVAVAFMGAILLLSWRYGI